MNIRNSIIDQLEHETDKYTYALSIGLKSGEVVFLDGVNLGEKNAYLNFAKYSKEIMLLEIDDALYRIGAEDIESINVKRYGSGSGKVVNIFNYLFLSKGRFTKATYIFWIKWFVAAVIFSIIFAAFKYVTSGDFISIIMDGSTFGNVLQNSVEYIKLSFMIITGIQILLFIIDLVLPPKEAYKRIKPYSGYGEPSKIVNLFVIVSFIAVYVAFTMMIDKIM